MTINLDFPRAIQLNRVEQKFNDATARDISVRHYSDPSSTVYVEYLNLAADVSTNKIIQAGNEYKYGRNSRLQLYYANFTAGKTVEITVQADEL